MNGTRDNSTTRAWLLAVAATFGVQAVTSAIFQSVPVMAPVAALALGLDQRHVGYFTALVYLTGVPSAVAGGALTERWGAMRLSQICLLTTAVAIALVGSGAAWAVAPAALILGLGYGPITPASSQLLARLTPKRFANITFSVKQTGVPVGHTIAGLAVPAVITLAGWQATTIVFACAALAVAIAIEPLRRQFDAPSRIRLSPLGLLRGLFAPVGTVWRLPPMRRLALISFVFATSQICFSAFLVVYLTQRAGIGLAAAGLVLAAGQAAGAFGRIFWGAVADASGKALLTLAGLTVGMVLGLAALAWVDAQWPLALLLAVAILVGATAVGWNGVFFAEISRAAPPGQAGSMTGGAMFFTFSGPLLVPPLFSLMLDLFGSYALNFLLIAACDLVCGIVLWRMAVAAGETARLSGGGTPKPGSQTADGRPRRR